MAAVAPAAMSVRAVAQPIPDAASVTMYGFNISCMLAMLQYTLWG